MNNLKQRGRKTRIGSHLVPLSKSIIAKNIVENNGSEFEVPNASHYLKNSMGD